MLGWFLWRVCRWKWAKLFLLIDDLIATGFAGIVLAMFANIKEHSNRLFLWFASAAIACLAYDLYSRILIYIAERRSVSPEGQAIKDYRTAIARWFIQDWIFLAGVVIVIFLAIEIGQWHLASQVALLAVSVVVLVLDVKLAP